jgi:hypothetical protein
MSNFIANATNYSNKSRFSILNSLQYKKIQNQQSLNINILKNNNNLIQNKNNLNLKIKSFLNMLGLGLLIQNPNLFSDFKELITPSFSNMVNNEDLKLIVTSINSYKKNIQVSFEDKIKLRLAVLNILKNKDNIIKNVQNRYSF